MNYFQHTNGIVFFITAFLSGAFRVDGQIISGELKQWHRVTLTFDSGLPTSEISIPNPFTDYRLNVTFSKGTKSYVVPGYFAADGNAENTSANSGSKWKIHFCPDETGVWNYAVSFRAGSYVALSDNANAGAPVTPLNGLAGTVFILPTDKTGNDFRGKGKIQYVGEHHLRFAGSGKYFVKGGSYCPENFLAYHEFDGTHDDGGLTVTLPNGIHQFPDHTQDWHPADPTWQNGKGKAIIGSLNYLASKGMNSLGFIVMNITGDGDDVWTFISPNSSDFERYDVSKLAQWEIVFAHMDSLGIALHIVLSERENQMLLDNGNLGNQRKLFYRELIARFSHHLGILWDLGEENGRDYLGRGFQTNLHRKEMSTYFKTHDPYKSVVCLNAFDNTPIYQPLLGYADFDGTSQQDYYHGVHNFTTGWRDSSANHGHKWVIFHDETRGGITTDDAGTNNHKSLRKSVLWGNLMGGGGGVEWFFGADDLSSESFRTRENVWTFTRYALEFFNSYLPFSQMKNQDALTSSTSDYCLALPGKIYAVYMPNSSSTYITLPCGNYSVKWFDPKNGGALQNGSVTSVSSGYVHLGNPPYNNDDWVALVTNNFTLNFSITNIGCANSFGQISANPLGGTPPYVYLWSTGATSQTISGLNVGTYSVTVTSSSGCPTNGNATVSNSASSGFYFRQRAISICTGESFFTGGAFQSQSGIYYDTIDIPGFCDSLISTQLTVHPNSINNIHVSICNGQSYYAGGALRTNSGIFFDTLQNTNRCDSIVITQLSVVNNFTTNITREICAGDSLLIGGIYRKTSGQYPVTLNSNAGCDSVIVTNLVVNPCNACDFYDCNNVCEGNAFFDLCGICVGGNTGLTACPDCNLRVNNLTLMYEGTFGPIETLTNGKVISRDTLCRFSIRANLCKLPVGSVKFILNGSTFRIENSAPYALKGDSPIGYYTPWIPAAGNYTLTVVPYSRINASGTAGTSVTVNFIIVNPSGGTPAACTTPTRADCSGKANGTAFIDACGICSGGTTGHIANSDKDSCGVCFGNNSTCCQFAADCNDNNPCTIDACESGLCTHSPLSCNDENFCTIDLCVSGICQYSINFCNDNNACTNDYCQSQQCFNVPTQQVCCLTPANCNDSNACTIDNCNNGQCNYQAAASEPPYLKVNNPAKSWRKLKLGYHSNNLLSPKLDVAASGNNMLCITLRDLLGTAEWNRIQIRPQASSANTVILGNFLPTGGIGNTWTQLCIPLTAFGNFNFTQISYFEFPYSFGANAFEIHIQEMIFTGGSIPFLWFGDSHTDNVHDGQSDGGSALTATLVPGQSCNAKNSEGNISQSIPNTISLKAYPNPFSEIATIEFSSDEDSKVKLEVFNLIGTKLAILYDDDVKSNERQAVEFHPASNPDRIYVCRLLTEKGSVYIKLMR